MNTNKIFLAATGRALARAEYENGEWQVTIPLENTQVNCLVATPDKPGACMQALRKTVSCSQKTPAEPGSLPGWLGYPSNHWRSALPTRRALETERGPSWQAASRSRCTARRITEDPGRNSLTCAAPENGGGSPPLSHPAGAHMSRR